MAYFINYGKFNEIRKHIHKHSNVSQHSLKLNRLDRAWRNYYQM